MTRRNASGILAVAEIGGTSVKVGFAEGERPLDVTKSFSTADLRRKPPAAGLAELLRNACREAGLAADRLVATVPGFIGRDFDTVLHASNIPELEGMTLASSLSEELGIPVRLERDVVLQLLGERASGAVCNETEILAVYFGTGIGAAYFAEAGIFRGGGWALEIGHMPVRSLEDRNGRPNRIEAYASGATLAALAARHDIAVGKLFVAAARSQDLSASLDDILWHQAVTVASAAALFSPRVILLGGGVVEMEGYPRQVLTERIVTGLPHAAQVQPLDVRWAELGWKAAIHGAILLDKEG